MSVNIILIIAIIGFSVLGFNSYALLDKYMFNAYQIVRKHQYYRLITHGFLHANWTHLLVNAFVLWSFGAALLKYFDYVFPGSATLYYLILFFSALIFSSMYSLKHEKNNPNYNSLGASGAVSAVLFASIFFDPWGLIYIWAIIPVPGIVFGISYLAFEKYSMSRERDTIAHDAHFYGAVYGFLFPLILRPSLINLFISQVKNIL